MSKPVNQGRTTFSIRSYPTPIARCDEQLGALLEERARLTSQLEKQSCSAEALWINDGGFDAT